MADTTDDFIAALLPPLAVSPLKDQFVLGATKLYSQAALGASYNYVIALRACHDFTLGVLRKGVAGQVTMLQEGRASIQFGQSYNTVGLMSTSFGQTILDLLKTTVMPGAMTLGG